MNAPLNHPLPLLDLDVLRTFVAIAETGSFTTAANAVFRTPSAVSMQIKKLEDILGRSVFSRDARSVSLTTDGEMLLGYAGACLPSTARRCRNSSCPTSSAWCGSARRTTMASACCRMC